jgi:hypothetical protein
MAIAVTKGQEALIEAICALGTDKLAQLTEALEQAPITITPQKIEALIAGVTGESDARLVMKFLSGMSNWGRQQRLPTSAVIGLLSSSLAAHREDLIPAWTAIKDGVERVLGLKSVLASTKVEDLTYDFDRVWLGGRIITDVRPVYNQERDSIIGGVIVYTLNIDYTTREGVVKSISLSVDHNDIAKLKDACEEALRKGTLAGKLVGDVAGLSVWFPGVDEP